MVTDDAQGLAAQMAPAFGIDPADALHVPLALIGTLDEMAERARVAPGRVRDLLLVDRVRRLGDARSRREQAGRHVTITTSAGWEAIGEHRELCGERVFTVDVAAIGPERHPPLLVLHGFPTSSFDYAAVLDGLRAGRRVLLFDMLGYGLSAKPDRSYTMALQADIAAAYVAELGSRPPGAAHPRHGRHRRRRAAAPGAPRVPGRWR